MSGPILGRLSEDRIVIGEFDIYGVYVPVFIVFAGIALLVQLVVKRLFNSLGIYRFVWHPPLFDLAVYVILLGAVTAAGASLLPLS
jgi:hypothetical protein